MLSKESIRKDFSDKIYPSMVIRSQAEAIELLEKENKELQQENQQLKKQKDDVVEYVNSEKFSENFPYTANEWQVKAAILRMLGEINYE